MERPDRRFVFVDDPHKYYRIEDCLMTGEEAIENLLSLGFTAEEAHAYLSCLPTEYE